MALRQLFFIRGGGFGVGYFEVIKVKDKDYLKVQGTEAGHTKAMNYPDKTLEENGASVPALINNFGKNLGLKADTTKALLAIGDVRILTDNSIELDKNTHYNISDLKSLQGLDVKYKEDKYEIKVNVNNSKLDKASDCAIKEFIDSLAQLAHVKALEGYNEIIIPGAVATKAIDPYLNKKGKNLPEEVQNKVDELLNASGKNMAEMNNFTVTTENRVQNNLEGNKLLTKGNFIGSRGNLFMIPVSDLKQDFTKIRCISKK